MSFPKTETELEAAGYQRKRREQVQGTTLQSNHCVDCAPNGKHIPLNEGTLEPHFATCVDAKQFC